MARKTIYCAQAFWRRRGRLEAGQPHHFATEERAMEGAEILSRSADGAAAFSLTGEPDVDYWDEPVILASYGACPSVADQTQPDAA